MSDLYGLRWNLCTQNAFHTTTFRYKEVAEQYYNDLHKEDSPPPGFKFDMDVCRRVFDAYDRDGSGYLEIPELSKLAEELWAKFHPEKPQLSHASKQVPSHRLMCLH